METQRIFFALPLPRTMREQLASMRDRAVAQLGAQVLRPIKTENFHITLQFLGGRPQGEVDRARETLRELDGHFPSAPAVSIGPPSAFPKRNAARVIWASADDEGERASEIHAILGEALTQRAFEPDTRPFHPHVTLAYVRKGAGRVAQKKIQRWLNSAGSVEISRAGKESGAEATELNRIVLYRSETGPGGSTYTELEGVELPL
ncbi:MAG: RNA 2',3'-cyclic phosphodiesterase [Spirochaetota bacterium]